MMHLGFQSISISFTSKVSSSLLFMLSVAILSCGTATASVENDTGSSLEVPPYMKAADDRDTIKAAVDSFIELKILVQKNLPWAKKSQADSLFLTYYRNAAYRLFPILWHSGGRFIGEYEYFDRDTAKLSKGSLNIIKVLRKNGIDIDGFGIGTHGVYFTNNHLSAMFGRYVSADLKNILRLKEHDDKKVFGAGCSFGISFKEIGDRVSAWESFQIKYPESRFVPMAKKWYYNYLHAFTHGGENNAIFLNTHDTTDMAPMYRAYIKKHVGRESARVVEKFLLINEAPDNQPFDTFDFMPKINLDDLNVRDFE